VVNSNLTINFGSITNNNNDLESNKLNHSGMNSIEQSNFSQNLGVSNGVLRHENGYEQFTFKMFRVDSEDKSESINVRLSLCWNLQKGGKSRRQQHRIVIINNIFAIVNAKKYQLTLPIDSKKELVKDFYLMHKTHNLPLTPWELLETDHGLSLRFFVPRYKGIYTNTTDNICNDPNFVNLGLNYDGKNYQSINFIVFSREDIMTKFTQQYTIIEKKSFADENVASTTLSKCTRFMFDAHNFSFQPIIKQNQSNDSQDVTVDNEACIGESISSFSKSLAYHSVSDELTQSVEQSDHEDVNSASCITSTVDQSLKSVHCKSDTPTSHKRQYDPLCSKSAFVFSNTLDLTTLVSEKRTSSVSLLQYLQNPLNIPLAIVVKERQDKKQKG
jgi:hypothetical protein